jgi:NAD(P)-dependent dehydrogenase (short-subunit alcohol dehydrogenase family)
VVTGASKGIGLAVAQALAAEGALVFAGARSIASLGGIDGVTGVSVDLSAPDGHGRQGERRRRRDGGLIKTT